MQMWPKMLTLWATSARCQALAKSRAPVSPQITQWWPKINSVSGDFHNGPNGNEWANPATLEPRPKRFSGAG